MSRKLDFDVEEEKDLVLRWISRSGRFWNRVDEKENKG
jgi:hypothetical protein